MNIAHWCRKRLLAKLKGQSYAEPQPLTISNSPAKARREGSDIANASAIVTAFEVSEVHGTGVLLQRVFKNDEHFIHIGCANGYNSPSSGKLQIVIPEGVEPAQALPAMLGASSVSRILVVPWHQQDIRNALAVKQGSDAKMCVWLMDHNPGDAPGNISKANMQRLVDNADLLLAISNELAGHYTSVYGRNFYFAPPVVDALLAQMEPMSQSVERRNSQRGVLVGNVWSGVWLRLLLSVLGSVNLDLEAFGSNAPPHVDVTQLHRLVRKMGYVPEHELITSMRCAAYALVPGGTLDVQDDLRIISRFSLPSRVLYMSVVGNLPLVYLGSENTAAARFIEKYDLGVVCPYCPESVRKAVTFVCQAEQQERFRGAAARAASLFAIDDMAAWIWQSVDLGRPIDERWNCLGH